MKTKNQTGLKNFKPKINLNHNIYSHSSTYGCLNKIVFLKPPVQTLFLQIPVSSQLKLRTLALLHGGRCLVTGASAVPPFISGMVSGIRDLFSL